MKDIIRDERTWRILTNFWTIVLLVYLIVNFASKGAYEYLDGSFSVIYAAVLGLYVSTKEFDRWYEVHEGRHPGEIFIGLWTAVIVAMMGAQFVLGKGYGISPEAIADYIMVLSVFAITQKSKDLHGKKRRPARKRS